MEFMHIAIEVNVLAPSLTQWVTGQVLYLASYFVSYKMEIAILLNLSVKLSFIKKVSNIIILGIY